MSSDNCIYLYCVAKDSPILKNAGILTDGLYYICEHGLCAIVSQVPKSEFCEGTLETKMNDLEWLKTHVEQHEKTIELVMQHTSVVPSKFATVFFNEQNLRAFLQEYSSELEKKLNYVENKEEWGIKIYCNNESLKKDVIGQDPDIIKINQELSTASPGKAYLLNMKKTKMLNESVQHNIDLYRNLFMETLKKISFSCHVNPVTGKLTAEEDDMIFNTAFLINRTGVPEFIEQVEKLKAEFGTKGFHFVCTGPWPPYNFCQLTQK